MDNILTTSVAASILGISKARVRKLIQEGRIEAEKSGRDYIIQESALQHYQVFGRKKIGRPKENYCVRATIME